MAKPGWSSLLTLLLVVVSALGCERRSEAWVVDEAALLSGEQRDALTLSHRYLLRDHDIDYRLVITSGASDLEMEAVQRFEALQVGGRSRTGRGLLLLLDPEQDRVRLEVSQALEGVYPDAFVAYLQQRQMVPFFRERRIADGIAATTELIVTRAQRAAARLAFDDEAWAAATSGAGASAAAEIGADRKPVEATIGSTVAAGAAPEDTLAGYFTAMSERNAGADLAVYTEDTRAMLRQWVQTPAQMDNVVRSYRDCSPEPALTRFDGRLAVIRYPIEQRTCAPWFFRYEQGAWRLDLTVMQQLVRFGRNNAWRFDRHQPNPYAFAFQDWGFDGNGYPHAERRLRWAMTVRTFEGRGNLIYWIGSDSAAERLGLRAGDWLLSWNGTPVRDNEHAAELMDGAEPDAALQLRVLRGGQELILHGTAPPRL